MAHGGWRIASGLLLLPAAVAGAAGCGSGAGSPASVTTSASAAKAAAVGGISAAMLREALLTRVNGVAATAPASTGRYASVSGTGTSAHTASGVQVIPKACTAAATLGFDPTALAGAPAAAVTFRVGTNGVSEVLIASSAKSASSALAGHVPAACTRYEEKVGGKTFTYGVKEQPVTGIGTQAKILNFHAVGATDDLWSLIYRGTGFVGTVTVIGPNASEQSVQQLGKQAYAYAAKNLS